MVRYAYGGYDGYIKNRGQEIGYSISGTTFFLQSGVLNLQGWEVEIDANGVEVSIDNTATKRYFSVYLEVNCGTDSVQIKSLYDTAGYPSIPESDDLTQNTIGVARLLLYHFTATSGVIADVEKMANAIEYEKKITEDLKQDLKTYVEDNVEELKNGLLEGTIIPNNAKNINGLEIKRRTGSVLKIGDFIIPQKKLIWSGYEKGTCKSKFF